MNGTDSTTEAEREAIWRAHRLAEGLRSLANMVATTTDPEILSDFEFALGTIIIPVDGRETLAAYTRAGLAAGAKIEKYYSDSYAGVRLVFGPVSVRPYDSRDKVCERVVTGTKEVTKQVADPEWVTEVPTVTVTETVEVVEWNCDSFLKPTPLDLPILTPFVPPTQPFAAPERTKTPPPPVGGPSHPDGPAIPGLGGESVEDSEPALCDECETTGKNCLAHGGLPYQYTGMSDHVVKAIGDLLLYDPELRGYEDPAAVTE